MGILKRLYAGLNFSLPFQEEPWKKNQLIEPLENFSPLVSAGYKIYCPQGKSIFNKSFVQLIGLEVSPLKKIMGLTQHLFLFNSHFYSGNLYSIEHGFL